jgi:hypothetical protein
VKDWRRGGVVELQRGSVKLPRWSSGTMGFLVWELRGDQRLTGEEEGGGDGVRGSGRLDGKRASGMEREEASVLLNQKRGGEGACMGGCCGGKVADGRAAGRRGTRARGLGRRS